VRFAISVVLTFAPMSEETKVEAYVDGSYIDGSVGYGAVILQRGEILHQCCGGVPPDKAAGTRQVAGELVAVGKVLLWCKEQNIRNIHIYYDYKGIECWATGAWKTNLPLTQNYAKFVKQCIAEGYRITWHKVKSHTGNHWNDQADALAKAGALKQDPNAPLPTAPTNPPPTAEIHNPLTEEAERKCKKFAVFLAERNIEAIYDRIYNNMYARLKITLPNETAFFDLYNTKKKPLQPYLHHFSDATMQERILRFWEAFNRN